MVFEHDAYPTPAADPQVLRAALAQYASNIAQLMLNSLIHVLSEAPRVQVIYEDGQGAASVADPGPRRDWAQPNRLPRLEQFGPARHLTNQPWRC